VPLVNTDDPWERSNRTVAESVATYERAPGPWRGCVRLVAMPKRSWDRFQVALVDSTGSARHAARAPTAPEATRVAEGLQ